MENFDFISYGEDRFRISLRLSKIRFLGDYPFFLTATALGGASTVAFGSMKVIEEEPDCTNFSL
jgi:hypothetical protein